MVVTPAANNYGFPSTVEIRVILVAVTNSSEGWLAPVFFNQDGEEGGGFILAATELPEASRHADPILTALVNGINLNWDYGPAATENRKNAVQDRFDRLSNRASSG